MDPLTLILIPIALFTMITIVTCALIWLFYQSRLDHHETIRRALDMGQSLDPELLRFFARRKCDPSDDLRGGVVALCVGLAFFVVAWVNTSTLGDANTTRIAGFAGILTIGFGVGRMIAFTLRPKETSNKARNESPH